MTEAVNSTLNQTNTTASPLQDDDSKQESVVGNGVASITKDPLAFLEKIQPILDQLEKARPYAEKAYAQILKGIEIATPYYEKYWDPMYGQVFFGFVLLFFGGNFAMTIACFTAVQISGWKMITESWSKLCAQYANAKDAAESDEIAMGILDTDHDGRLSAAEVMQAGKKLASASNEERWEMMMGLKNVVLSVDPNEVTRGVIGIWTAILTVVATLRSTFAKDIALGVAIGEILQQNLSKFLAPYIQSDDDTKEVKVWKEFVIGFICRGMGVSLALILARVVSAFHSAVSGGQILALVALKFVASKQLLPLPADGVASDEWIKSNDLFLVTSYSLAAWGFVSQLKSGFAISNFFLRLLLLPFVLLESILTIIAAY